MYYMYKDRHENDTCRLQEDEDLRKKKEQKREVPGAAGSTLLLQLDGE